MYQLTGETFFRLLAPLMIVLMVFLNRTFNRRDTQNRVQNEIKGLILGLRLELQAMRDLYEENLDDIRRGNVPMLSTRPTTSYYRSSIGRVTTLLPAEIAAAIVAIFTTNETVDTRRVALFQKVGKSPDPETIKRPLRELKEHYHKGCEGIKTTLAAIDGLTPEQHEESAVLSSPTSRRLAAKLLRWRGQPSL